MILTNSKDDDVVRLVKYYVSTHKQSARFFDSFEDYLQELLLRVLKALPLYDESKGSFSTYIMACCHNHVLQKIRILNSPKHNGIVVSLNEEIYEGITLEENLANPTNIANEFLLDKTIRNIKKMLIPESYKFYINGFSQTEIAKQLGVTKSEVNRRIRRNIRKIKKYIDQGAIPKQLTCFEMAKLQGISLRTYFRRKAKEKKNGK